MDMDKYDVFISCKSEDYQYAEEVYDFLVSEGIKTFLASKELRELGESDYREAIEDAMGETTHIIVFASNPEYVRSKWIKYEWGLFVNEKISDRKQGNIVTILNGVEIGDLPIGLRKYQSFPFKKYKEDILKYVETDASKVRKEQILKQKESEYLKLQQQREREEKKKEIKEELIKTSEAYKKTLSSLQFDVNKIYGLLQDLDIKVRECPICGQTLPIKETSCLTCGWILSPLDGIKELSYLNKDNEELREAYKNHYTEFLCLKNETSSDSKELEALNELKVQLEVELQASKEENLKLTQELKESTIEKNRLEKDLESYIVKIHNLEKQIHDKEDEILKLSKKTPPSSVWSFIGNFDDSEQSKDVIPGNLTIQVGNHVIELKRVSYPDGDFYITYQELPANIKGKIPEERVIKKSIGGFKNILVDLKKETGYTWDVPSIQEWKLAYRSQTILKYNSFQKELCYDIKDNKPELFGLTPPFNYTKALPNEQYVLHAVIRVKDNPQLD